MASPCGGDTPPISLSLGKRNGPRPVQRESAFRRISMTRPCHADRKARGPKKKVRADTTAVSVGRGPSFADCFSLWPAARNCNAMVLNRFGVRLFPLPLAGVPGQRVAKRNARGQQDRPFVVHSERSTHAAKCGGALPCSTRPKRTRYRLTNLHRNDHGGSGSSLLDRPAARLSPPKCRRFAAVGSDTRLRALSLLRKKRKWGAGLAAEPHVSAPSADGATLT